jgi:hypothetical protein
VIKATSIFESLRHAKQLHGAWSRRVLLDQILVDEIFYWRWSSPRSQTFVDGKEQAAELEVARSLIIVQHEASQWLCRYQ